MTRKPANQPSNVRSNNNLSKQVKRSFPKRVRPNRKLWTKGRRAPRKKWDRTQNSAINKLSRQVNQLQMARYGKVQMNYQTMLDPLIPTKDFPITFNLNDISCKRTTSGGTLTFNGCRFYQANASNQVQLLPNVFKINVDPNVYWDDLNKDGVDTGGYYLDSVTYFFNIKGRPNLDDTRVRIDVIAQKSGAINSKTIPTGPTGSAVPLMLPWSLPYFRRLVGGTENRINPLYFKKYPKLSKTFYFNSQPASGTTTVHPTTANSQHWSFTVRPKKAILQQVTYPQFTPGQTGATAIDSPYGPDNVDWLSPLHCIISTDDISSAIGDQVNVTVSRRTVFRDMMGSALYSY